MIKNIIFDMGGVIVDIHLERAVNAFKAIGLNNAEQLINPYSHKGVFLDYENGNLDTDEFCCLISKEAGRGIKLEDIENAWKCIIDKPVQYKMDFLDRLREKYKVFMLTNNNPLIMNWACSDDFTDYGRPMSDYFDRIYTSFGMKCTKPDMKIFNMMLEDAGLRADECLFVDDGQKNINTAQELGMNVYLAKNGDDWRQDILDILKS
jgi:putative hydrolase of the HAD superfamily